MNRAEDFDLIKEIQEDNKQTDELIIYLGIPTQSSASFEILSGMMTIYSLTSYARSETDRKIEENRNAYLLESLIETINYEPTEETFIESEMPQLRRANATKILVTDFERILKSNPEGIQKIMEALIIKLDQKDDRLYKFKSPKDLEIRAYTDETNALFDILKKVAENSDKLDGNTTRILFNKIFDIYPLCEGIAFQSVETILRFFLNNSSKKESSKDLNDLVDDLLLQSTNLNKKTPKGLDIFNEIISLNSTILSKKFPLPTEEKVLINKKIFEYLQKNIQEEKDINIKMAYLYPFSTIISAEEIQYEEYAILEQYIDLRVSILQTLTKLLSEETEKASKTEYDKVITRTLDLLYIEYLKNYKKDFSWKVYEDEQDKKEIFKENLNILLNNILEKKRSIKDFRFLADISRIEDLEYPFRDELITFYTKYFKNISKKKVRDSK